jgi:hypothetical protein
MKHDTIFAAAFILVTACGGQRDIAQDAPADTPAPSPAPPVTDTVHMPASPAPTRPRIIEDTVMIEGLPQIERSTLVSTPPGFGVPFSTYLPQGMRLDDQADAGTVRFLAAFGGTPDRDAYMEVHAAAQGAAAGAARDVASRVIRGNGGAGADIVETDGPAWADDAVTFTYRTDTGAHVTGRVVIAHHSGLTVHIIAHYPSEYGDGLGPRVARILEHWRWEDSGTPLT